MNAYELSRSWFDFCFENPEKICPGHTAIFFFAIEHCNRMGWKEKFGFPSQMAMEALGIKKHQTFINYFNDLVEWKFIRLVQKSKNQYSANIISLTNALPKKGKALDKAIIKHRAKQIESTGQSTHVPDGYIDKPIYQYTNIPVNNTGEKVTRSNFIKPDFDEVCKFFQEKKWSIQSVTWDEKKEAESFYNYYESNGWKVGKNKMSNWKSAASGWINRIGDFKKETSNEPPMSNMKRSYLAGQKAKENIRKMYENEQRNNDTNP